VIGAAHEAAVAVLRLALDGATGATTVPIGAALLRPVEVREDPTERVGLVDEGRALLNVVFSPRCSMGRRNAIAWFITWSVRT
jgi:hypothetical protein